jgi:hypothetical protein
MKSIQFRQGDVYIKKIDSLPKKLKSKSTDKHRVVLAYGEVTGHAHAFYTSEKVQLSTDIEETKTYLKVLEDAELKHEEHATIVVPIGDYEVIQQSEYQMGEIRRVAD